MGENGNKIIGGIAALAIAGGATAFFMLGGDKDKTPKEQPKQEQTAEKKDTAKTDTVAKPVKVAEKTETPKAEEPKVEEPKLRRRLSLPEPQPPYLPMDLSDWAMVPIRVKPETESLTDMEPLLSPHLIRLWLARISLHSQETSSKVNSAMASYQVVSATGIMMVT